MTKPIFDEKKIVSEFMEFVSVDSESFLERQMADKLKKSLKNSVFP
ncbi:MAG: hypothetical protein J6113_06915 [Lachnospiraceae bacterium]|nr:hypothetical protein [Lachnospiraceae bacterium]